MDEVEMLLVARAIQRDADAFTQLYTLYFDRLLRFVQLRVPNPADAEDVAAGVFLNAWRSIERFSPKHEASFVAWLFRLAHNALVDRYRRERDTVSLDSAEPIASIHHNPEAEIEWQITLSDLQRAINDLTEEQRDVVLLRFVEGFSARTVGDILGKQEGAVRGMQFRAIEALRRALRQAQPGGSFD